MTNNEIKQLWNEFGDIPMNPETECMEESFLDFPAGTHREEIWHWFDEHYSEGVYALLYPEQPSPEEQLSDLVHNAVLSWCSLMEKELPYDVVCDKLFDYIPSFYIEKLNLSDYAHNYIDKKRKKLDDEIHVKILDYLDYNYSFYEQSPDYYCYELEAGYNDVLGDSAISLICNSNDIAVGFEEYLDTLYDTEILSHISNVENEIADTIDSTVFDSDYILEAVSAEVSEHLAIIPPYEHFFKQKVCVTIIMDTGDGNFDYTLNNIFSPEISDHEQDDKASIVWLLQQQGYTKEQLYTALSSADGSMEISPFLKSVKDEIENCHSHMNALTFLVQMTLKQVLDLNEAIHLQDRNGRHFDATENPDCGTITLDKTTTTGLFDCWNGCGSVFDIELEKPVVIPIALIRSALPDGYDHYGVRRVYDMLERMWKPTILALEPFIEQ